MNTAPEPQDTELILRTPPLRRWLFVGVGLALGAIGFYYAYAGVPAAAVVGLVGVLMVMVNAALLAPGASYLRLTADGFEVCAFYRREALRWQDVRRFTLARGLTGRRVAYMLAGEQGDMGRRLTRAFSGEDGTLPDTYGRSPEDLLALVEGWRTRALTGR